MFFPGILKHPSNSISVITGTKSYKYSDLIKEINYFGENLKRIGVKPGEHYGIITDNNFYFIPLLFALWSRGAVPVILNPKLLKQEIRFQAEFAGCRHIFIHKKYFKDFSFLKLPAFEFPFSGKCRDEAFFSLKNNPEDTAVIIFTSGSSAKPKAVMLSFENLFKSALIGNKDLNINSNDRLIASLPFCHIGGFSIITRSAVFGSSVIIPDSLSAGDLIKSINLFKPTAASLVSNQLKKIVEEKIIAPEELRLVLVGGGFFDKELIMEALKLGWKIGRVYGSTETSSFVAFMDYREAGLKPGASGKAVSPNEITITGDGEILVNSPAVMKGYYNNEEETSLKLKNGKYYSGDIGYLDKEGYLYVQAKREDLIVSGGENINPVEVEKVILSHRKVSETSVVGIKDKEWGQAVAAAVVLKEKENLSEKELKNFLIDRIAAFEIPKKFLFLKELPKTELGKIRREEVRNLF